MREGWLLHVSSTHGLGAGSTAGKFPSRSDIDCALSPRSLALPLKPVDIGHVFTLCCVYWLLLVSASQYSPYPPRSTVLSPIR